LSSILSLKALTSKPDELRCELEELYSFPREEFLTIIRDLGFSCTGCGRCCTRAFNDHVFLLDDDVVRIRQIMPEGLIPAPYFEVCDQHGIFYVSGYALRCQENGDCIFLEKNRCTIYDDRFRICRVYPFMLHKEIGEDGKRDWRQIAGLNEHGDYHTDCSEEECLHIADETIRYEEDVLKNEIAFYSCCAEYFAAHGLRPVRRIYDQQMRLFESGKEVTVMVFSGGTFEKRTVTRDDYCQF